MLRILKIPGIFLRIDPFVRPGRHIQRHKCKKPAHPYLLSLQRIYDVFCYSRQLNRGPLLHSGSSSNLPQFPRDGSFKRRRPAAFRIRYRASPAPATRWLPNAPPLARLRSDRPFCGRSCLPPSNIGDQSFASRASLHPSSIGDRPFCGRSCLPPSSW